MALPTLAFTRPALHAAYAAGLGPRAVAAEALRRAAAVADPGIFLDLPTPEEASREADALPPFDPGRFPLWGLPVAVKDNIDVAGRPTTAACPAYARVAGADAPAVARLRAAGALIIGKTNLDQFATGLVGVRTPHPAPRNVRDPSRVPGGSSSGSAVAVAHGIVALALGTDTAGSGRVPAALNGIVGLKPSLGAVSTRGVVPACRSLDTVSVFAGSVADAWAGFAAIAGADPEDPWSRPIDPGDPALAPPPRLLGVPGEADLATLEPAARTAWDAALALLRSRGFATATVDLSPFLEASSLLYGDAFVAEREASFGDAVPREAMHPVTRAILEGAARFSAADAFRATHRLAALRHAARGVLAQVDSLAVPSVPCVPTLADLEADPFGPNARLGTFTNFVNLFDLAALAVPGPDRPDGLPAGLTLIGPRGSDPRLAAAGLRLAGTDGTARRAA